VVDVIGKVARPSQIRGGYLSKHLLGTLAQ